MRNADMLLEIAPPTLRGGERALAQRLDAIAAVAEQVPVAAVNIPEIREESSHGKNGERLQPFEPRMPPRAFAARIARELGIANVINHVIAHEPPDALRRWLEDTCGGDGVRGVVLVGGEHSHVDYPGPTVTEANAMAGALLRNTDVRIGNICIPSRTGEAQRVRAKRQSGADFFSTQILYRTGPAVQLLDALVDMPATAFYFSFCPIKSARNLRFLEWLGVDVPPGLEGWLLADRERTLTRSKDRIETCWRTLCDHLTESDSNLAAHLNLSLIGKISIAETVDLARRLLSNLPDHPAL